jgi:hypothetical protein
MINSIIAQIGNPLGFIDIKRAAAAAAAAAIGSKQTSAERGKAAEEERGREAHVSTWIEEVRVRGSGNGCLVDISTQLAGSPMELAQPAHPV